MSRKLMIRLAVVLAALGSLVAIAPASPAAAGTCGTPGCGGYVINSGSSGVYVFVSNNWCWSSSNPYFGSTLPCAPTWNAFAYNSYFLLAPGDNTNNYSHYYDTDAIRIDKGCKVFWYNGTTNFYDNTFGSAAMWVKLTNLSGFTVTNAVGSGCIR